jgi:formylglycine-generating enzyme required for sulfatase activity
MMNPRGAVPASLVHESPVKSAPEISTAALANSDKGVSSFIIRRKAAVIAAAIAVVILGILLFILLMSKKSATTEAGTTSTVTATLKPPPGMLIVRGGKFMMGTDDPTARAEWAPLHEVEVADFFLDQKEVTNREYQEFVKSGYPPPPHWKEREYEPGEGDLPVTNITWDDANAYAQFRNKRLPTEAEWEYAARGKEGRIYPWGNDWDPKKSNSKSDPRNKPVNVGSYIEGKSWCGAFDMAGNVAEWVEDEYRNYANSKALPQPAGMRIFRGGAFSADKEELKSYVRWAMNPSSYKAYLGFRCAKDVAK